MDAFINREGKGSHLKKDHIKHILKKKCFISSSIYFHTFMLFLTEFCINPLIIEDFPIFCMHVVPTNIAMVCTLFQERWPIVIV